MRMLLGALWDAPRCAEVTVESVEEEVTPAAQILPNVPADAPAHVDPPEKGCPTHWRVCAPIT